MGVETEGCGEQSNTGLPVVVGVEGAFTGKAINADIDPAGLMLLMALLDSRYWPLHVCGDTGTGARFNDQRNLGQEVHTYEVEIDPVDRPIEAHGCVIPCFYTITAGNRAECIVGKIDGVWNILRVMGTSFTGGITSTNNTCRCCGFHAGSTKLFARILSVSPVGCGDYRPCDEFVITPLGGQCQNDPQNPLDIEVGCISDNESAFSDVNDWAVSVCGVAVQEIVSLDCCAPIPDCVPTIADSASASASDESCDCIEGSTSGSGSGSGSVSASDTPCRFEMIIRTGPITGCSGSVIVDEVNSTSFESVAGTEAQRFTDSGTELNATITHSGSPSIDNWFPRTGSQNLRLFVPSTQWVQFDFTVAATTSFSFWYYMPAGADIDILVDGVASTIPPISTYTQHTISGLAAGSHTIRITRNYIFPTGSALDIDDVSLTVSGTSSPTCDYDILIYSDPFDLDPCALEDVIIDEVDAEACGLNYLEPGDRVIIAKVPFRFPGSLSDSSLCPPVEWFIIRACSPDDCTDPCEPPPPPPVVCCGILCNDLAASLTATVEVDDCLCGPCTFVIEMPKMPCEPGSEVGQWRYTAIPFSEFQPYEIKCETERVLFRFDEIHYFCGSEGSGSGPSLSISGSVSDPIQQDASLIFNGVQGTLIESSCDPIYAVFEFDFAPQCIDKFPGMEPIPDPYDLDCTIRITITE